MGIRVLVTGGRDYQNAERVNSVLTKLHEDKTIIELGHGAARGADTLADEWAKNAKITRTPFPVTAAEWNELGKKAGVLRNQTMLDEFKPDLVVEFPGGTGTQDMVKRAKRQGVPVRTVIDLSVPISRKKKRKK